MLCFYVAQTEKHLLRTQDVAEQNQKHFLCPQQMLRARANGETFVSLIMCPQQCVLVCQGLKAPSSLLPAILSNRQVLIKRLELLHTVDLFDG